MRNKRRNDRFVNSRIESIVNSIPNVHLPVIDYTDTPVDPPMPMDYAVKVK